jgi:hypothetical protein
MDAREAAVPVVPSSSWYSSTPSPSLFLGFRNCGREGFGPGLLHTDSILRISSPRFKHARSWFRLLEGGEQDLLAFSFFRDHSDRSCDYVSWAR